MESRAMTAFNTGNLVFKTWCPWKFPEKHRGDRWCMFRQCDGKDSYEHVRFECAWYDTKFEDTGLPIDDNAKFLMNLDTERRRRWNIPLIVIAGF